MYQNKARNNQTNFTRNNPTTLTYKRQDIKNLVAKEQSEICHRVSVEIRDLRGCFAACIDNPLQKFQNNLSVPSSRNLLNLEKGIISFPRNVRKKPIHAVWKPRRMRIGSASREGPEITQGFSYFETSGTFRCECEESLLKSDVTVQN